MTEDQLKAYVADVKARFEKLEAVLRSVEEFLKGLGHSPKLK